MKLSEAALKLINTPAIRHELAGVLNRTEQTIIRYIKANMNVGPLTTLVALEVIERMTKLPREEIIKRL
jgi:predicted transcriptional regulator